VNENRPKLAKELSRLGFAPYPSDANFILAKSPVDHGALTSGLERKGILVRDFGSKEKTENCIRTTVGTDELNSMLIEKIEEVLQCLQK
jgi:histidinol-phosphate aminotransferase